MPSFDKYLQVKAEDIPETMPFLPLGHFFCDIAGWKLAERDYDKATGGPKTVVAELSFKVTGADDDVEAGELPKNGGVGMLGTRDYRLSGNGEGYTQIRMLAEKTCGLPVAGLDFPDILDSLKGQPVKCYNVPRPDKNNEGVYYTDFKKVLPAHG